ncbi:MAG: bifunctional diaminohydroxyphosphoribosylaminopyrimidine deaminase/5-amino-6-(5-phosphoribosylamino)uracil reductase RibD [candidate division Zixibacteria bacterium]|nr:bifunctional diaminohydroxyphosphoribosylaminopyrimidine deaminase/5-amino-6-(5-phosphoribosylamino)uracil reductase RibD [candidate division Zixibacteria bacterium]
MAKKAGPRRADIAYMQRALDLAGCARGKTSPNPMVGAVIVKNGRMVAEGYHRRAGTDHAEVVALKKAGSLAAGAAVYVSLEPCCHTGQTGPCTEQLIKAGIKKVFYAVKDPDPRVNGKGERQLKKAGIEVTGGVLKDEAVRLNEIYFCNHLNKRPFIILKTVQSLDGRIATVNGDSQWISGSESLRFAHQLRAEVDAVVVGAGTVRSDNPSLTVRRVKGNNPYRIILSDSLDLPRRCRLLDDNGDYKTVIASTPGAIARFSRKHKTHKPIFWEVKKDRRGRLELYDFISKAAAFGLHSLLIEGGAALVTSFLKTGLFDKYVVITAPVVIGRGIDAVGDLDIQKLSRAISFNHEETFKSGRDMIFIGYPERKK